MVKKQIIMESALELFADNGIEATSIQQITEKCGISKGAFYLAFSSKAELVIGIIDNFLSEIVADVERSVSSENPTNELLYKFYYTNFSAFEKRSDFARILMKEQSTSFSAELLEKFIEYDQHMNSIVFSILDRQFGEIDGSMYPDLVYLIKGFLKIYAELLLLSKYPIDIEVLCHALVERTKIIAEHATIQFISKEFLYFPKSTDLAPTKEELMALLKRTREEMADSIVLQSIDLLIDDLNSPQLSPAVIQGLLKNLRSHSHSKWTAYLFELYLSK